MVGTHNVNDSNQNCEEHTLISQVLRFIHRDDSDEKIVLFLVSANQLRER